MAANNNPCQSPSLADSLEGDQCARLTPKSILKNDRAEESPSRSEAAKMVKFKYPLKKSPADRSKTGVSNSLIGDSQGKFIERSML